MPTKYPTMLYHSPSQSACESQAALQPPPPSRARPRAPSPQGPLWKPAVPSPRAAAPPP